MTGGGVPSAGGKGNRGRRSGGGQWRQWFEWWGQWGEYSPKPSPVTAGTYGSASSRWGNREGTGEGRRCSRRVRRRRRRRCPFPPHSPPPVPRPPNGGLPDVPGGTHLAPSSSLCGLRSLNLFAGAPVPLLSSALVCRAAVAASDDAPSGSATASSTNRAVIARSAPGPPGPRPLMGETSGYQVIETPKNGTMDRSRDGLLHNDRLRMQEFITVHRIARPG